MEHDHYANNILVKYITDEHYLFLSRFVTIESFCKSDEHKKQLSDIKEKKQKCIDEIKKHTDDMNFVFSMMGDPTYTLNLLLLNDLFYASYNKVTHLVGELRDEYRKLLDLLQ